MVPAQRQPVPPDKMYMEILDRLVGTALVAQAARKAKIQDDAEVKRRLALVQDQLAGASLYRAKWPRPASAMTKLKAQYDEVVTNAPPREEVNARHILLNSEAEAKEVIKQLKSGADFDEAGQGEDYRSRRQGLGGDLGYFTEGPDGAGVRRRRLRAEKGRVHRRPRCRPSSAGTSSRSRTAASSGAHLRADEAAAHRRAGARAVGQKMQELQGAAKIEEFNADGSRPSAKPGTPPPAAGAPAPPTAPEDAPPTLSPATKPKD